MNIKKHFNIVFILFPSSIKMETNPWQNQILTEKLSNNLSALQIWCECCQEYVLKSESSTHFKSYESYHRILQVNKNSFKCKICSVIYLPKWAMFKHFFLHHPVPIQKNVEKLIQKNDEKSQTIVGKTFRNTKLKKRETKKVIEKFSSTKLKETKNV